LREGAFLADRPIFIPGKDKAYCTEMKEVRIMSIFFPEYLVLFLVVLAGGWKALKTFRADSRDGGPPEKKVPGKKTPGKDGDPE